MSETTDYPEMITPRQLRDLADGLENRNAEAERVARIYHHAERVQQMIGRLSGEHYGQIQRDLLSIIGWRHYHVAHPEGGDECFVCGQDIRAEVHLRAHE